MAEKKIKVMLVDGNALVHRGFHAIPDLTGPSGEPTGAIYGFTTILLRAIKDLKPTHVACCFDLPGATFRHLKYKDYKATRVKAPQELYDQIPRCKDVVRALGIPVFEKPGFEADDLLGTLSRKICTHYKDECKVAIVTGDMDTLQLVNDCVSVHTLRKGITDVAVYGRREVHERYSLTPDQLVDYRAIRGDASDNIKGVKGIGEKGAIELIKEFGSIKELYKAIDNGDADGKIKERVRSLLLEYKDDAFLSHELSVIDTDVDVKADIPEFIFTPESTRNTLTLFSELGFKSLVAQLPKVGSQAPVIEDDTGVIPKKDFPVGPKTKYYFLDTEEKVEKALDKLKDVEEIAFDTETTSINPTQARVVGVSLSPEAGTAYYIERKHLTNDVVKLLEKKSVKKIGHNIKYDLLSVQNEDIALGGVYFDTMIAAFLLDSGTRRYSIDDLSLVEFGHQKISIETLIGKGKSQITMDQVDPAKVAPYACEDADYAFRLKEVFEQGLKDEKLDKIFFDFEMPLIPVLARMERAGILLDVPFLNTLTSEAEIEIKEVEAEIHKLAGEEFNVASTKQLKEVLFDKLGLEATANKKVKTGLSTAAAELEKMRGQHPIIERILEYREIAKLYSTYLSALPLLVNERTGRIHTSYNQTIASTGRLSSTDPNLQNIPVASDEGLGGKIRQGFVAKKGYKLLSLDYSQIELRVAAHVSQDKNMVEIFNQGEDIHTNTAMAIFGVEKNKVTQAHRRDAKTVNFGILYGLQAFGLSSRIGTINHADAKDFIDGYFLAYPGVKQYMEQLKQDVRQGFVRSQTGRLRKFPEIRSKIFALRAAAERAAMNFPIQSLAADIIKVAMINIDKEFQGKEDDIQMLLQVHDELVFEVKEDKVDHYAPVIKKLMETSFILDVPLLVEAKAGDNWGQMKRIDLS